MKRLCCHAVKAKSEEINILLSLEPVDVLTPVIFLDQIKEILQKNEGANAQRSVTKSMQLGREKAFV